MPIGARCTFLDWQHSFFNNAERFKCSIFLLGADKDTIELTHKKLAHQYPQVRFNSHHGYFENDGDIVSIINKCHVDILLVGMGMPKQELWISKNLAKINSRVVMPIGGYFDYIGEKTHTPNRFWSNIGLEWIIRLIHDPKRLSYRYLVEPWYVLIAFIKYTFSRPR
jgi:N-acetylglucosaminyldiphosphoundecaprenol N-acetyl-beta-D-mannosaminyltransferase